jgi:hypothetical protein
LPPTSEVLTSTAPGICFTRALSCFEYCSSASRSGPLISYMIGACFQPPENIGTSETSI